MSEQPKLGKLCDSMTRRDAIHVAIAPVQADVVLLPGNRVGADGKPTTKPHVGIVDPFLDGEVKPGQWYYICLFPGTVTTLRHAWEHPAFKAETTADPAASRVWIEAFACRIRQRYEDLMTAADEFLRTGEYTFDNNENYKGHWHEFPEFWKHYEIVTGRRVSDEDKESVPFTCSC